MCAVGWTDSRQLWLFCPQLLLHAGAAPRCGSGGGLWYSLHGDCSARECVRGAVSPGEKPDNGFADLPEFLEGERMIIYPAIDLRGGKVVRLKEGDPNQQKVFSDDPIATAQEWIGQGATWIHIVNLDGAFASTNDNARIL